MQTFRLFNSLRIFMRRTGALATLAAVVGVGAVHAQEAVKIGVVATLEGPFAVLGQDAIRGAELAIAERGGKVAVHLREFFGGSGLRLCGLVAGQKGEGDDAECRQKREIFHSEQKRL